jgi:hypothetical protein
MKSTTIKVDAKLAREAETVAVEYQSHAANPGVRR